MYLDAADKANTKVRLDLMHKNVGLQLTCRNKRVFVANVENDTEASVHLQPGDRIVTLNGKRVDSTAACDEIIQELKNQKKRWLKVS